jgi:hypothetical protein
MNILDGTGNKLSKVVETSEPHEATNTLRDINDDIDLEANRTATLSPKSLYELNLWLNKYGIKRMPYGTTVQGAKSKLNQAFKKANNDLTIDKKNQFMKSLENILKNKKPPPSPPPSPSPPSPPPPPPPSPPAPPTPAAPSYDKQATKIQNFLSSAYKNKKTKSSITSTPSTPPTKIPENIKYVNNEYDYEGITLFTDHYLTNPIVDAVKSKQKIGWLMESREVDSLYYNQFDQYKDKYDYILTHDEKLLEQYPNKTKDRDDHYGDAKQGN